VTALTTVGCMCPTHLRWPGGDVFAIHLAIYLLIRAGLRDAARRPLQRPGVALGAGDADRIFHFRGGDGRGVRRGRRTWTQSVVGADWLLPDPVSQRETTSMFPGVISHDFHKKEGLYNQYLQQVERQRQRGWQVHKGWVRRAGRGEPALFRVAVQTREAQPLAGATVVGQFLRHPPVKLDVDFSE
jgi:hypothetical protein